MCHAILRGHFGREIRSCYSFLHCQLQSPLKPCTTTGLRLPIMRWNKHKKNDSNDMANANSSAQTNKCLRIRLNRDWDQIAETCVSPKQPTADTPARSFCSCVFMFMWGGLLSSVSETLESSLPLSFCCDIPTRFCVTYGQLLILLQSHRASLAPKHTSEILLLK